MVTANEDALICDLAETYCIYDWRALPLRLVATLASGLRDDSRIKTYLSGSKVTYEQTMLAVIADRLSFLAWAQTEDGSKGINRPKSILELLTGESSEAESEFEAFESLDEFMKKREEILSKGDTDGC